MEIQETSSISTTPPWREFANNVSGEWDGYGADFTTEGKPIELPENVVPEAYREWEVRVFDWQTQCPTIAKPEESSLMYKLIQLLPTVGCEADAATRHSIDERNVGGADNKVSAFAYDSSGCYVAVWPLSDNGVSKLFEVEHCLVDPQNRESRVRIVQVIRVDKTLLLQNIKVYREQWYGPFRNGDQLGGCSIRDTAFASTDATKGSEVIGSWHGSCVVARFQSQTDIPQQLINQKPLKLVRDDHGLIFLPKQLWCSLKEEENGETCAEVGWLFKQGSAITSRCSFTKDGKLKEVAIGHETLQEV
ncbi:Glycerol kinase [Thalictrum thalictroides]|uniref:Glycerol kinase n=1 Tax=Thalictrum thalictroides TaxID=46969 RepID=A0A7J6V0H2_THATH|nr:Glycerol kinase [Thalictrum thalictroides]